MDINVLYEKARYGDTVAEKELFSVLSVRFRALTVQRIGNCDDCDDIVQNAMLTISKEYRDIEFSVSFAAWAHKVLMLRLLKYYTTRKRAAANERSLSLTTVPAKFTADPTLESRIINCLRRISRVNNNYARTLNLHYQGYTTSEVCRRLKITATNAYVILSRARSMLKSCLEDGDI